MGGVATLVLAAALAAGGQAKALPCRSAEILDDLWRHSFSAVEQTMAAAGRGEVVNGTQLSREVEVLGAISDIEPAGTHYGYMPDEEMRTTLGKWRNWRSRGLDKMCAQRAATGSTGDQAQGCEGQRRLTRLWLSRTRFLERALRELERSQPVPQEELAPLTGFFERVTGLAAGPERPSPWLDLTLTDENWQEWFADHVGTMCGP